MAVLVEDSADHGRSERAVRERPIRNRKASVVGSDQGTRDEQEKRTHGGEDCEAVDVLIGAWGGHGRFAKGTLFGGLPLGC